MSWLTKILLALVALGGSFVGGYVYRGKAAPQVVTVTKVETKEVEKIVTKIVKVKEVKPDGTVTETETSESSTDSETVTDKNTPTQPVSPVSPGVHLQRYSLGVTWTPRLEEDAFKPTGIEFGRRFYDTNLWTTASWDWRAREATVGIRIEF